MYQLSGQRAVRRSAASRGRRHGTNRRSSSDMQARERLIQLAVCLTLFLAVFLGKAVFPERLVQVRDRLSSVISSDLDIQGALSRLGGSLSQGDTVLADLGEFCVEVFGNSPRQEAQQTSFQPPQPASVLTAELRFLSQSPDQTARATHYTKLDRLGLTLSGPQQAQDEAQPAAEEEAPPAVPAAGTVVMKADYTGQPLPENYTMDQISLGELETVTPVLGHLNSVYGYRDHPIDGRYQFHGGVDIGGQIGDPIAAFAAGTVEYVGKDDSYGLYFQLDHGNGVRSFYAHCSEVLVSKGQSVAMGETVAKVGASGSATGPHLHLELKYNKLHLDPIYYVEVLEKG